MQTGTRIEEIFEQAGALRDGHFLLKSGRHSGRYLEKFAVLQHPSLAVEICRRFAEALAPFSPTVVVGPTTGGVLLAFETARQLGGGVRGIFAEPVEGSGVPCALPLSLPPIDLLPLFASIRGHADLPVRRWGEPVDRFVSQQGPVHRAPRAVVDTHACGR